MTKLIQSDSWKALRHHYNEVRQLHMLCLFDEDPKRFDKFSIQFDDLLLDFSKNRITKETISLLLELARELDLKSEIDAMVSCEKINITEDRAVLHMALRAGSESSFNLNGIDIIPVIHDMLEKMNRLSDDIRNGVRTGYTGRVFTDIVNIGIGGSELGPMMVADALKPYWKKGLNLHFVSNVDGTHLSETLSRVNPETTLFIVSSKSFTTQDTLLNAKSARNWLVESLDERAVSKHFIAISTNLQAVKDFGIEPNNMFEFWDWVGGRFSVWSAIGLATEIMIGKENFNELLAGAHEIDKHFTTAPFEENIPVIMALLGVWYNNFFGSQTHAILPYDQSMHKFAAHFQQVDMESNGKSVDRNGNAITDYTTGPVIWGEPGTNGQHAFYQLIHQGRHQIPADFLIPIETHNPLKNDLGDHHKILLANFFAQTEALMRGKKETEVYIDLKREKLTDSQIDKLLPHRVFEGNRPTNSLIFKKLTPRTLGRLIAIYEHKIFVQGIIWNINSFDQWGVEIGKQLTEAILPELEGAETVRSHDCSTNGLINYYKENRTKT